MSVPTWGPETPDYLPNDRGLDTSGDRLGTDPRFTGATAPNLEGSPAGPPDTSSGTSDGGRSTSEVAKQQARDVKDTAVDAGKGVAATARDQASNVASEAGQQAKGLLSSAGSELRDQASQQQHRAAGALQSWAQELGEMASKSEQSGTMSQLADRTSRKAGEVANWLDDREPTDVLDEVKTFARRRPVTFLAACGIAGVLAGRLTKGAMRGDRGPS